MRPLQRPPIPTAMEEQVASALLMQAFGQYCMVSERPVLGETRIWHAAQRREVVDKQTTGEDWEDLYLLDPNTAAAISKATDPEGMHLPDRDLTFKLTDSPFIYRLEIVPVTYLDDDGNAEGDPVDEEFAIVRGATPAAERTVEAFALNSVFYDIASESIRMRRSDYLSLTDNRLHERTHAWRLAEQTMELIRQVPSGQRDLLLDQARLTVAAAGFWSVWATVLWNGLGDEDAIRRVLEEPEETAERFASLTPEIEIPGAEEGPAPSTFGVFPGTRADWYG